MQALSLMGYGAQIQALSLTGMLLPVTNCEETHILSLTQINSNKEHSANSQKQDAPQPG